MIQYTSGRIYALAHTQGGAAALLFVVASCSWLLFGRAAALTGGRLLCPRQLLFVSVAASCRWHDRVPRPRGLRGTRPPQWSRSCQSYPQARWTNPKMDTDTHTRECMHHTPRIPIVVGPATQAHPTRPPAATRHTRSSKHNGKPVQSTLH